jgi:NAD(P)-dependent dehydrogenase (short-subunit alcohol dehydrogenase family)
MDLDGARAAFDTRLTTMLMVARHAAPRMRSGGTIVFLAGTGTRRPAVGLAVTAAMNEAAEALVKGLALEVAPVRVNLIAAGFVDTPLSAALLGDHLDERRAGLRATLPIRRVVQPEDVAELALHLMANTAITGGIYDIDGGEQLL